LWFGGTRKKVQLWQCLFFEPEVRFVGFSRKQDKLIVYLSEREAGNGTGTKRKKKKMGGQSVEFFVFL